MSCPEEPTLRAFAAGTLEEAAADALGAHLVDCPRCTRLLEPLASAAPVRAAWLPRKAPERLRSTVRWTTRARPERPHLRALWAAGGALAAGLLVVLAVLASRRPEPPALSFERIAVGAHEAYLSGAAPLDLQTSDASALRSEFSKRLKFPLQLPPMAGVGLELLGARLIQAGGQLAAVLVYQQGADVLSLSVAPKNAVSLGGGQIERFRGVDFAFSELGGRRVVQWTEGDSAYVLVSTLQGSTHTSCGICHAPGSGLSNVDEFHHPE